MATFETFGSFDKVTSNDKVFASAWSNSAGALNDLTTNHFSSSTQYITTSPTSSGQYFMEIYSSNPDTDSGYEMVEVKDLNSDLVAGKYNIPEPDKSLMAISPEEYDRYIWLIPGVAFDTNGVRLGRGKGVYDRLLGSKQILVIGVFYEYQKFDSVPFEPHDRKIDIAVTEKSAYRFN